MGLGRRARLSPKKNPAQGRGNTTRSQRASTKLRSLEHRVGGKVRRAPGPETLHFLRAPNSTSCGSRGPREEACTSAGAGGCRGPSASANTVCKRDRMRQADRRTRSRGPDRDAVEKLCYLPPQDKIRTETPPRRPPARRPNKLDEPPPATAGAQAPCNRGWARRPSTNALRQHRRRAGSYCWTQGMSLAASRHSTRPHRLIAPAAASPEVGDAGRERNVEERPLPVQQGPSGLRQLEPIAVADRPSGVAERPKAPATAPNI